MDSVVLERASSVASASASRSPPSPLVGPRGSTAKVRRLLPTGVEAAAPVLLQAAAQADPHAKEEAAKQLKLDQLVPDLVRACLGPSQPRCVSGRTCRPRQAPTPQIERADRNYAAICGPYRRVDLSVSPLASVLQGEGVSCALPLAFAVGRVLDVCGCWRPNCWCWYVCLPEAVGV